MSVFHNPSRILAAGDLLVVRAHVLEKEVPAARLEHPANLSERAVLVFDRAEEERRDHRVERRVLKRETLDGRGRRLDRPPDALGPLARTAQHAVHAIRQRQLVGARRVVREIEPRAGADLEHTTFCRCEQLAPVVDDERLLLNRAAHEVVDRRYQPVAKGHRPEYP
jgi:hypothetical protein